MNTRPTPSVPSLPALHPWCSRRYRSQGFTLSELLIVILIIVILFGLSFPMVTTVRAQALSVKCLSNLRQIGLGALTWSQDNRGYLMPGNWSNHTENTMLCDLGVPAQVMECPLFRGPATEEGLASSYGMNQTLTWGGPGPGSDGDGAYLWGNEDRYYWIAANTRMAAVRNPGEKIYFMDATYFVAGYWWSFNRPHNRKANIVWMDGHASAEPSDFGSMYPTGVYSCFP